MAFRPRGRRSPAQVAGLAAAVIVAVQLPAMHWFYMYIVWFLPLVLISVLAGGSRVPTEPADAVSAAGLEHGDAEPVLAGAA